MRFLGNIEAKVDTKGRVFLPAVFRKILQQEGVEQLVMRKDVHEKCLVLYPDSIWNVQEDILRNKLNRWNRQEQMIFRQFVSDVEITSLDSNGRLLISHRAMEMADIKQAVRFIGVGDTIEIWAINDDTPYMEANEFSNILENLLGNNDNIAATKD